MTRSNSRQTRRGGGCNIVPKGYTGPWHYEGDAKCKGDPPSNNNNNGRGASMAYQMKAYSTNGGRKTRRGRGSRRSGGGCNIASKNYKGPWHRQGELKCKGDPPSNNNNNGRGSAMAYQMKAYSTNGGRKSRRGSRRTRGGACGSMKY